METRNGVLIQISTKKVLGVIINKLKRIIKYCLEMIMIFEQEQYTE